MAKLNETKCPRCGGSPQRAIFKGVVDCSINFLGRVDKVNKVQEMDKDYGITFECRNGHPWRVTQDN